MPVMGARRSAAKRVDDPTENGIPGPVGKKGRLCTDEQFREACILASKDPASGADRMEQLAQVSANGDGKLALDNMVELASLCVTGLSGPIGSRRSLRYTASLLLEKVLAGDSGHLEAMCLKGEMLIPRHLYGFPGARNNPPLEVLEQALALFTVAADSGSNEGRFLKGRYLVSCAPLYRQSIEAEGKQLVEEAAKNGSARALVFLAQRLEFDTGRDSATLFGRNIPDSKAEREKIVFDLYLKAADMGNGDALNDVGSCYATAFGSCDYDFDMAVKYYVRAIDAGSLHAFDNLGTHYEYGMSGNAPGRIDLDKAIYYYKAGAKMRCSKCALNLATSYEEGLGNGTIQKDPVMAEKYLKYAMAIANDEDDTQTASSALKELVGLLITRIKTNPAADQSVKEALDELKTWLPRIILKGTLDDIEKSILKAVKEDDHAGQLGTLIGDLNALRIFNVASKLINDIKSNGAANAVHTLHLKHVFGQRADDAAEWALSDDSRSPKRRRSK